MSEPVSILGGRAAVLRPGLRIADCGPVGQVTLRGDLSDPALPAAVERLAGVTVPERLRCTGGEERQAVWMSPDEILLVLPRPEAAALAEALREALADRPHMALDVSDARAMLTLEGGDVAETLAKGTPMDLSEAAFPVGTARRSHLGPVAVALWRTGPEDWRLVCFCSYARHVWLWLETVGHENARVGWA